MTSSLVARAAQMRRRRKRDVYDNSVLKYDDPRSILINDGAVPPAVCRLYVYVKPLARVGVSER